MMPPAAAITNPARLDAGFAEQLAEDPHAPALISGDQVFSYMDVEEVARSAGAAISTSARPGDTVIVQYATRLQDLGLAVAASRLGMTFVPVPGDLGRRDLAHVIDVTGAKLFVAQTGVPEGLAPPPGLTILTSEEIESASPVSIEPQAAPEDRISIIGFTSGSTGSPKGVMHTWHALRYATQHTAAPVSLRRGDPILLPGAGAGAPGFAFFSYLGLTRGNPIVRPGRWDPDHVLTLLERHRVTWTMMVPTVLLMILDAASARATPPDLSELRVISVGGSPLAPELVQRARDECDIEVLRMFGLSECLGHATMKLTDPPEERDLLDGRPFPGTEVRAFDETGRPLPSGTVGEAGVRGPSLFRGYVGDAEATSRKITDDGFFLTGDLIEVTSSDAVRVVGRKKDMIIRGGLNLDPAEIEHLTRSHPRVADVVVVGVPDERLGERACAIVIPEPGDSSPKLEDLTQHLLAEGLSKTKLPERLVLTANWPLSPDGKVRKADLQRVVAADPTMTELA